MQHGFVQQTTDGSCEMASCGCTYCAGPADVQRIHFPCESVVWYEQCSRYCALFNLFPPVVFLPVACRGRHVLHVLLLHRELRSLVPRSSLC